LTPGSQANNTAALKATTDQNLELIETPFIDFYPNP